MPTVEIQGVPLYWAAEGTGPTVLFVHGIPTDYRAWAEQTRGLSAQYRVLTYSRRYAHPNVRAGDVRDSTIQHNADDLAGLVEQIGSPPVHLVGHSYGGFVAAYLATRRPELLRSLTLVEPAIASLLLRNPRSRGEALRLLLRHPRVALSAQRFLRTSNAPALAALERHDLDAAVRFGLDGVEDRVGSLDRFPPPVRQMMLDNGRTVRETDTPYPPLSRTDLASIRVPTLVVHGSTSVRWLRAVAQMTASAIPGSQRVCLPDSGHFPHVQDPAAFNRALQAFLARVATSP
jgi:pimeloyl-ACP methyl ester carboxylesterase